jgi:hypothetical protein
MLRVASAPTTSHSEQNVLLGVNLLPRVVNWGCGLVARQLGRFRGPHCEVWAEQTVGRSGERLLLHPFGELIRSYQPRLDAMPAEREEQVKGLLAA